jgi:hypothetical protein
LIPKSLSCFGVVVACAMFWRDLLVPCSLIGVV